MYFDWSIRTTRPNDFEPWPLQNSARIAAGAVVAKAWYVAAAATLRRIVLGVDSFVLSVDPKSPFFLAFYVVGNFKHRNRVQFVTLLPNALDRPLGGVRFDETGRIFVYFGNVVIANRTNAVGRLGEHVFSLCFQDEIVR